ncbi:MAG: hypothetical protein K0R24_255 [Gammaproteobacteria bacterium]|nr:hypothetical protein [Gammaproteobacteria bacterium]
MPDIENKEVDVFKNYVSEIDLELQNFDKQHPSLSLSQQKEREKYERIYLLRDHPEQQVKKAKTLWENF